METIDTAGNITFHVNLYVQYKLGGNMGTRTFPESTYGSP